MYKNEMDVVLKYNNYLEGGTKEACIKARDFLKCIDTSENEISSRNSCVTSDEFIKAVKTLIAFSFNHPDNIPQRWNCDNSCMRVSDVLCPGECNIQNDLPNLCPYYIEED